MLNTNLLRGKAMIVALVILGSSLGLAGASIPPAFAANGMSFYSNPRAATVMVDGAVQTYGWTGTFAVGERVHVVASPPPGGWEFLGWVVNGASVDSPLSQDTYVTIQDSQGSVTAVFQHLRIEHLDHESPEPPTDLNID